MRLVALSGSVCGLASNIRQKRYSMPWNPFFFFGLDEDSEDS